MENEYPANICLDVAIIKETYIDELKTDRAVLNENLICFGEAKHMSAFAESIASFIGMVHELLPGKLENIENADINDLYPFLYVSGRLNPTAKGLRETIEKRNMGIRIYSFDDPMA
ncbi:MAG: hypothetical protein LBH43_08780 [Treponema sp.]|nr:hypothetical protein [Treponema sp.]